MRLPASRELWTRANSEYGDEHAVRAWAAEDITWGNFNVPRPWPAARPGPPLPDGG